MARALAMALENIKPKVITRAPQTGLPVSPELLWPSVEYSAGPPGYCERDCREFPEEKLIRLRYQLITGNRSQLGLEVLREQMYLATTRILILDLFFPEYGYPFLRDAMTLTTATDIRIVSKMATGAGKRDVRMKLGTLDSLRNPRHRDHRPPSNVDWKARISDGTFPHLHDRFAIVDGELWHFGATVGGGHPNLNAVSRGWDASARRALEFFEEVWRTL